MRNCFDVKEYLSRMPSYTYCAFTFSPDHFIIAFYGSAESELHLLYCVWALIALIMLKCSIALMITKPTFDVAVNVLLCQWRECKCFCFLIIVCHV